MSADYYNVLGVERGATPEEIKRAYRKRAHEFHPDKESGDEDKFKEVNEAYQVLSDEQKRAQYDQFGQTFDQAGAGPGPGFGGFNVNFEDLGGMGDMFEEIRRSFGGERGRTRQRRGEDVGLDVTVSFVESAQGVAKEISPRLHYACSHCQGNGAEPGTPIKECATCQGRGVVQATQQTILGVMQTSRECSDCRGEGKKPEKPCTACHGEGREAMSKTLEVHIPAGIADGQTIRLQGKGPVPEGGGSAGDLYIKVHVTAHDELTRHGNDVHSELKLDFTEAILGVERTVTTLSGEETVVVPAGTQPGAQFRLDAKGFTSPAGGQVGDQVVTANVELPRKLNREQKKLLKDFQRAKKGRLFS